MYFSPSVFDEDELELDTPAASTCLELGDPDVVFVNSFTIWLTQIFTLGVTSSLILWWR